MAVTIWKEAGFFMVFFLAALQQVPPVLYEAARMENAGRWLVFRRITWPLVMPTTLFVAVNALINAFRVVDQVIAMTGGGPNNATTLLLFYIFQVAFSFWDTAYAAALSTVLLSVLAAIAFAAVLPARSQDSLSLRGSDTSCPNVWTSIASTTAAWLFGLLWALPLLYAIWAAFHPSAFATNFDPLAPLTLAEFRARLDRGAVRPLLPQYHSARARHHDRAVRDLHAGGVRAGAPEILRQRGVVRADPGPAHGDAGCADPGKLPDAADRSA